MLYSSWLVASYYLFYYPLFRLRVTGLYSNTLGQSFSEVVTSYNERSEALPRRLRVDTPGVKRENGLKFRARSRLSRSRKGLGTTLYGTLKDAHGASIACGGILRSLTEFP